MRSISRRGGPTPAAPLPDGVAAIPSPGASDAYELVHDVSGHGGWSLRCRRGGRVAWSMPLAPRGAAPGVRPAVAQAVAVRVLGELGVFVSGWNQLVERFDRDDAPRFVARRPRRTSAVPV